VLRRVTASLDGVGQRAAIEIEADIRPGDSGAAVVDDDGRIAGLVFASSRVGERGWVVAASELSGALTSIGEPLVLSCE
jgi:S1-C subfamily serine protease